MDRNRGLVILVYAGLVLATAAAYQPVCNNGFVNYDDDKYVIHNANIKNGLTLQSLYWAFTNQEASNWHPLTWISHILDYQFFQMNPLGHHLTNVLLHIINTLLLFYILQKTTGALWPSAFTACLFAVHPLHVESVAWIAERKDVLSTLFGLLTIVAYIGYVKRPSITRYVLTTVLFASGLMAKPMLVTLPFVLLLLDYWPLKRPINSKLSTLNMFLEKVPLFILAAISSVITYTVQKSSGAVTGTNILPLSARISNAMVSYISYIGKMIYPSGLAVLYPYPQESLPIWKVIAAAVLLVTITSGITLGAHRQRYLLTGWLWYLGTLVPVIGIVQVGYQTMADRYTYLPSVGIFIIVAWSAAELLGKKRTGRIVLAISSALILAALVICTRMQIGYWRDSVTLFEHAIDVTKNNYRIHHALGLELILRGKVDEGISHYRRALEIMPENAEVHHILANALRRKGNINDAIEEYRLAVKYKSDNADALNDMGYTLLSQGNFDEAKAQFSEAIKIDPNHSYALTGLAQVFIKHPNPDFRNAEKAVELAERAATLTKNQNPVVLETLAAGYAAAGRFDLAVKTAQ
jgi:Tfp pilus assembly protein PilF